MSRIEEELEEINRVRQLLVARAKSLSEASAESEPWLCQVADLETSSTNHEDENNAAVAVLRFNVDPPPNSFYDSAEAATKQPIPHLIGVRLPVVAQLSCNGPVVIKFEPNFLARLVVVSAPFTEREESRAQRCREREEIFKRCADEKNSAFLNWQMVGYDETMTECFGCGAALLIREQQERKKLWSLETDEWLTTVTTPFENARLRNAHIQRMKRTHGARTLFIKLLTGRTLQLDDVDGFSTIRSLKERIASRSEASCLTPDQQRLIFAGKDLGDDRTVDDYCLLHESYVHQVLRLRAACQHEHLLASTALNRHRMSFPTLLERIYFPSDHCWKPAVLCYPEHRALLDACCGGTSSRSVIPSYGRMDPKGLEALNDELMSHFHWILRSVSPSPNTRWTPENDRKWPMPFRKVVRYVLKICPPRGHGHPHDFIPREVAQNIAEFL